MTWLKGSVRWNWKSAWPPSCNFASVSACLLPTGLWLHEVHQRGAAAIAAGIEIEQAVGEIREHGDRLGYLDAARMRRGNLDEHAVVDETRGRLYTLGMRPVRAVIEVESADLCLGLEAAFMLHERPVGKVTAQHDLCVVDRSRHQGAIEPVDSAR